MQNSVPTGPETKNDCAGEDQQQFTGLDRIKMDTNGKLLILEIRGSEGNAIIYR
jgi:hypothetical protein